MSPSISKIFRPPSAASLAMARAVVDLPSPARLLVIISVCGLPCSVESSTAVRIVWYASDICDCGRKMLGRALPFGNSGVWPRSGVPKLPSTSSGARTPSWKISRAATNDMDMTKPMSVAHKEVEKRLGRDRKQGRFRTIHDRDVIRRDARFSADFLIALKQAVIELTVSRDLTLQDIVLDAELLLGEREPFR